MGFLRESGAASGAVLIRTNAMIAQEAKKPNIARLIDHLRRLVAISTGETLIPREERRRLVEKSITRQCVEKSQNPKRQIVLDGQASSIQPNRARILHLLCEGQSIRAITRLTGASKKALYRRRQGMHGLSHAHVRSVKAEHALPALRIAFGEVSDIVALVEAEEAKAAIKRGPYKSG